MLIIAVVVAVGTVYESRYNSQVSRIIVYRSVWFQVLMAVLWLNIFFATVSRIPFKKHHTGFVITHIGLLTLLIGGQLTSTFGTDGQLRVLEGKSSNTVILDEPVLQIAKAETSQSWTYEIARSLSPKSDLRLGSLKVDTGLSVESFQPFVTQEQQYIESPTPTGNSGIAVNFSLQSAFFNVKESLHSVDRPEAQMGPAHLSLVTAPVGDKKKESVESSLLIKEGASGLVLGKITLSQLRKKPLVIRGAQIFLVSEFKSATVSSGNLAENAQGPVNPAIELKLVKGDEVLREVAFANYPVFSLNPTGSFGLKFEYSAHQHEVKSHLEGNSIEFQVFGQDHTRVKFRLSKDGVDLLTQEVKLGETLQTPWMGIKITPLSIVRNATLVRGVKPTEMVPKESLPPSAVLVRSDLPGSHGEWLIEGEAISAKTSTGTYEVFYGSKTVDLPFQVKLEQFRKVDYPGTETPMSFESTIFIDGKGTSKLIQMNEPFENEGYLLYQSSYEMGQGNPTASIFSVNKDPGRLVKYIGAVILILGIAVLTIMRSKWYLNLSRLRTQKRVEG